MVPGYTHLGSEVVHHILATAFHGEQPSEKPSSEPATLRMSFPPN
jgi:hypothetical protein